MSRRGTALMVGAKCDIGSGTVLLALDALVALE